MRARFSNPLAATAIALLTASTAAGQVAVAGGADGGRVNADWTAWIGCWSPEDAMPADPIVCIVPTTDPASVRVLTVAEAGGIDEMSLQADGVARPISEDGCVGEETATWSRDGRRVFTTRRMDCPNLERLESAVMAFVSTDEWVDVETLTVAGQNAARVIRYEAVDRDRIPDVVAAMLPTDRDLVIEAARLDASAPLGADAVIEAAELLPADGIDALLAARDAPFDLNAESLVRLDEAGVPGSTIDVMVALTFPEAFDLQPLPPDPTFAPPLLSSEMFAYQCRLNRRWNRWYQGWYRGNCLDDIYYSDWRYTGYGFYDDWGWNFGRPVVIVVPDGEVQPPEPSRLVPGQGYTRGGAPAPGARTARPRSTSGPAATTSPSGSGSSSRTPAASGGSSSSRPASGSSKPTRTAVPRNQ